jgi:hypothetical protein
VTKNKVIGFFLVLEKPIVIGETFPAMMENTALCHVLWEQFSSQMMHHLTSPIMSMPMWRGGFLIVGQEKGNPLPDTSFPRFDSSGFFILGVCKRCSLS